jgi:serine/threonine protein kinase
MNKQQLKTQCDSEKLELFLRGAMSSSETKILELHLTECECCAQQIQITAEHGVSWHEVQSLLAADEYDSPQHIATISSLLSDEDDQMTKQQTADVLSREIRGWLDATDDPRSMGRFAGYEIVGIVGHGGMGIVLKGFETSLNRFVAIKILAPRLATNGSARKRFAREAQAAAAVRHDNVIAIHRVDEWHGLPFLVMPYAGGISLQKRIDCEGPLSIEQTLRVGVQIASGLAAAHAQGLIHRDIKPANILLEQGVERVTITDFGLARAADDASVTRTGIIAGTPQYMSPEQAEAKPLDARSDLFSLGSVLYAMATGRPPFHGAGSFEVLQRIVNEPARPIREIQSSVPEWFEKIVNRLHSKSPNDRPTSASEVAELLQQCLAHVQQPTTALLPDSLTAKAKPDTRNHRLPIDKLIMSAVFMMSLIFAGVLIALEVNKGTLTIECETDDVPIRIMQGDKLVEKLTISAAGKSVRVAAGNYKIEIDGSFDNIAVNGGKVTLKRGQTEVVRISHSVNAERIAVNSSLEKFANLPEDTEVHVVGCYTATNNQPVNVRVQRTGKPMVVVLNAYFATSWNLEVDKDADVRGVILSGYFDQRFSHVAPRDAPTQILTYFPIWKDISREEKKVRVSQCFYVWSPLREDFGKMQSLIHDITERDVTTFQGIYSAESFVIDGQRGVGEVQIAARWQNLSKRSDRDAPGYRKTLAQMELVSNDDNSGMNPEQLQRLNQLMDAYEKELSGNGDKVMLKPAATGGSRAWQQTDPYIVPSYNTFFPDSKDGAVALGVLWNARDKDSRSDDEILETVRSGFRNTSEHRMPILRWIGNKYIWNKSPQNLDAIEIMYHAADFSGGVADPSEARHAAVYFGLSVTQPKTPAILRTLAELSMRVDDPNDLDRIAWGCSNQKSELLEYLKPFHESDDEAVRNKADVCRRIFNGELKAFAWAAEQARQRAETTYSSQLPKFKETLMSGSSDRTTRSTSNDPRRNASH